VEFKKEGPEKAIAVRRLGKKTIKGHRTVSGDRRNHRFSSWRRLQKQKNAETYDRVQGRGKNIENRGVRKTKAREWREARQTAPEA